MQIKSSRYVISAGSLQSCPEPAYPEFAFIGRSNVGKSSLINMLTGRKMLARISVTPGKTQKINFFLINESWYLVDLPGYGYARRSKLDREAWDKMVREYLKGRGNLKVIFLLIDSRIEPQASDLEFMSWLADESLPFVLVFTKTDKLARNVLQRQLDVYRKKLEADWDMLPLALVSSAITASGREAILQLIENLSTESE